MLDPANGVAKGEGDSLMLQHVQSSAVEEHDWETLVYSCENGRGEHLPGVERSSHNWCSAEVKNRIVLLCTPCIIYYMFRHFVATVKFVSSQKYSEVR